MYGSLPQLAPDTRQQQLTWLSKAFKSRAAVIADQAHNPRGALGEGADFMRGLDENERQRELKPHDIGPVTDGASFSLLT